MENSGCGDANRRPAKRGAGILAGPDTGGFGGTVRDAAVRRVRRNDHERKGTRFRQALWPDRLDAVRSHRAFHGPVFGCNRQLQAKRQFEVSGVIHRELVLEREDRQLHDSVGIRRIDGDRQGFQTFEDCGDVRWLLRNSG